MTDDRGLMALGMAPGLARELAKQVDVGTGDARRLMIFAMPSVLASEVAAQVTNGAGKAPRLMALGMDAPTAVNVARMIGAEPSALSISGTAPAATVDTAYSFTPTVRGGEQPYAFAVSGGFDPRSRGGSDAAVARRNGGQIEARHSNAMAAASMRSRHASFVSHAAGMPDAP